MSDKKEESKQKASSAQLEDYAKIYMGLEGNDNKRNDELEVVFDSINRDGITRLEFESVISKLKSLGFSNPYSNSGKYHLNIQNQYINPRTGRTDIGNIRTTIDGIKNIQEYCKVDSFDFANPPPNISFMQKVLKTVNGKKLYSINFEDFKFRVNYKEEKVLKKHFTPVSSLLETWNDKKKVFRLIKRFTFTHHKYPVKVDCSIVKSSKRIGRRLIPEFRIESSGIFNNLESYEIEIEATDNARHRFPSVTAAVDLVKSLKQVIKIVLSGIQGTNFPISYNERARVIDDYMHILYKDPPDRRIRTRDFVGPSSISLERPNVAPLSNDSIISNIRKPYAVTEKADGIRKLLMIDKKGKIYMIDVNMNVQFTGAITEDNKLFNSILDGEHVLHDKKGLFINNYLVFDVYYINKKDLRSEPFYQEVEQKEEKGISVITDQRGRLIALNKFMVHLKPKPIVGDIIPIKIKAKEFQYSDEINGAIFKNCALILNRVKDDLYEYETDGLIFTPANTGVGSNVIGEILDPVKRTWRASFKWKPPEHNTIDFLVTTLKNESGEDVIKNIFENGDDMRSVDNITQYKTLQLRVGFDERKDGYLNPCEDIIQDRLPKQTTREEASQYKPIPFYPTNPTPQFPAYLCNMLLEDKGDLKVMTIEDKSNIIENEMIVEFKYDPTREKYWQWVPIKVRMDKTADYRSGGRNYGNSYPTAQSVWNSIHNPITEEMITTGENIPDLIADDDIYYNKKDSGTSTRALRDFHNLYIKRVLILATAKKGGTLIDMTVGKGGDFPKWIAAKLSFVFGIDLSRDNIENRLNGVCARFLNYRKQFKTMPYALFVNGNSGLNIKSTEAIYSDKGKEITRAIFGDGPKNEAKLGKGVFRQYAKCKDGFDVVSNQFAIHYFFKDALTLNNFLRNVSECCKVGGYFIGTSYDGREVFRQLETKSNGESISIRTAEGVKMWEIRKQYDGNKFENDVSSLGYRVDVYQESINKTFSEYLVNYEYLTRLLENYGFVLLNRDETRDIGLPSSIGGFDQLFYKMESEIKNRRLKKSNIGDANNLTTNEKKISFLNKYFVFKKVRQVDAEKVSRLLINKDLGAIELEQKQENQMDLVLSNKSKRPRVVKLKHKLKISTEELPPSITDIVIPEEPNEAPKVPTAPAPGTRMKIKIKKTAKIKVKGQKGKINVNIQ